MLDPFLSKNMDKKDCLFSSETFLSCSERGRGFKGTKHAAFWEHRPPSPRETLGIINRLRTFCLMGIVDGKGLRFNSCQGSKVSFFASVPC
jgi:hypothetical protein